MTHSRDILMLSATSPERLTALGALLLEAASRERMTGRMRVADALKPGVSGKIFCRFQNIQC